MPGGDYTIVKFLTSSMEYAVGLVSHLSIHPYVIMIMRDLR